MTTTWIVILSLFILIILVVITRVLFSFLNKNKKENNAISEAISIKNDDNVYEKLFIEALAIFEMNRELQLDFSDRVNLINNFIMDKIEKLMSKPEYIFKKQIRELDEILDKLLKKLIVESPYIWDKKFLKDFAILKYKVIEFINRTNELEEYKNSLRKVWYEEWDNGSSN